jgi:hypothetical protein
LEYFGSIGIDKTCQLCVYVGEECVIDVYMSPESDPTFNSDNITVNQSSSKTQCFGALCETRLLRWTGFQTLAWILVEW